MSGQAGATALSVVVPVYNEAVGLPSFHASLVPVLEAATQGSFEVIYCDDGSADATAEVVLRLHEADPRVKLLRLSRNFGKEYALTAGVSAASGEAIVSLDGDGQHPVELIPAFLEAWRAGARVVIGVRGNPSGRGLVKRSGSYLFYKLFNGMTAQKLVPGSTDFRLIDRSVQRAFLRLEETDRITRGLIDWLGFERAYVPFTSKDRAEGRPSYGGAMLLRLALNSIVSLSPTPLYLFAWCGIAITLCAGLVGLTVLVEQIVLGDPLDWDFTGTAMLSILLLFLVGMIFISQGILSLYISRIHNQSKRRPLYIVDDERSAGLEPR